MAVLFFQIFRELARTKDLYVVSVIVEFSRNAFGGPIIGFIGGLIGSLWMRRIIRDDVLTATVTFVFTYIVFYFTEFTWVNVSGILAVVVLSLMLSSFGKTKLYVDSEHAVKMVWTFAQYACETIIFILTGVEIG